MPLFRRRLLPLLLLSLSIPARAARAADDPLLPTLRAIAPGNESEPLDPAAYSATLDGKPLPLADLYTFGRAHYIARTPDHKLYLAAPESPTTLKAQPPAHDSLDALVHAIGFAPTPAPPEGFHLRPICNVPTPSSRLAADPVDDKHLYLLATDGTVFRVDRATGVLTTVILASAYHRENISALGLAFDDDRRLYIVINAADPASRPYETNHVVIYRAAPPTFDTPKPWFTADYPYGIDVFNHGVSMIAQGPDGLMYVSSGSRTDHGERGTQPTRAPIGEPPLTACLWTFDPADPHPKQPTVYARGLRNMWGFCWDDHQNLWGTENGPNLEAPEELNLIRKDHHYGFPYRFSTMTTKLYPDQPDLPAGLTTTLPVRNTGPHAGGSPDHPLSTFDNHSSPSGITQLRPPFPKDHQGAFLVARFGNLLGDKDIGYDVLEVRPTIESPEKITATVTTFLKPLGRPVDLLQTKGHVYLLEYTRATTGKGPFDLPGRLWDLSPAD